MRLSQLFPFALLIALCRVSAAEDPVKIVHIVPGSHLDIGFTATPDEVRAKRIQILDDAIAAAQADPEFRWFEEAAWTLYEWKKAHEADPKTLATLCALLKTGQISVGAAWASSHAAMFSEWAELNFFHLADFEKTFGVRPTVAVLNDVPSFPEAIVDAASAAGVNALLIGANMAFSPAIPAEMVRTPFYWESAKGNRVLVWIDTDAYPAAYMEWGLDPATARFFNAKRFPRDLSDIATMEKGLNSRVESLHVPHGAAIVQHAFDNWDTGAAKRLPAALKLWNEAKKPFTLSLGGPEAFFAALLKDHAAGIPVRKGEWGGQWDAIRASQPTWTWRLREACWRLQDDASFEQKAALATAMEHSQGFGPGWPGNLDEAQVVASNAQVAALFARAAGERLRDSKPLAGDMPQCLGDPVKVRAVIAKPAARLRAGSNWIGPFLGAGEELEGTNGAYCMDFQKYSARLNLDRSKLSQGDTTVVVEISLKGERKNLSIAPENSASGRAGVWLTGKAPAFVVAPGGLRITGLAHPIVVKSSQVYSWCLVADKDHPELTWLQGLVVRQSRVCTFKDKTTKALPFETLYPGEPAQIEVHVQLTIPE